MLILPVVIEMLRFSDSATIRLLSVLQYLRITPNSVNLEPGEQQQFNVIGIDQFGGYINPGLIDWTIDNRSGSTINDNGLFVSAHNAKGNYTITANSISDYAFSANTRMSFFTLGVSFKIVALMIAPKQFIKDLMLEAISSNKIIGENQVVEQVNEYILDSFIEYLFDSLTNNQDQNITKTKIKRTIYCN